MRTSDYSKKLGLIFSVKYYSTTTVVVCFHMFDTARSSTRQIQYSTVSKSPLCRASTNWLSGKLLLARHSINPIGAKVPFYSSIFHYSAAIGSESAEIKREHWYEMGQPILVQCFIFIPPENIKKPLVS